MKRLFTTAAAVVFLCVVTFGQNREMSLKEIFALADASDKNIAVMEFSRKAAAENESAAKAQRLPDIKIAASGSLYGDGRVWDRNFSNGMNVGMPRWGNNLAVEASQLIYAGGAVSNDIKMAELSSEMSDLKLQSTRADVRFSLSGKFLQLHKLLSYVKIYEKNIELMDTLMLNVRSKVEQGMVLQTDYDRYAIQREELVLQKRELEDAATVINRNMVLVLDLDESINIIPAGGEEIVSNIEEAHWHSDAEAHSYAISMARLSEKISSTKEKIEKSALLPKLAFVAQYHLDGPITIEVPVLDQNYRYAFLGLNLSFDIGALYKNNRKVRAAKYESAAAAEHTVSVQQGVETAIKDAYSSFNRSVDELKVRENSLRLAENNYRLIVERYNQGLSLVTDVLDASNIMLKSEMDLKNSKVGIVYNYYQLLYLSGKI